MDKILRNFDALIPVSDDIFALVRGLGYTVLREQIALTAVESFVEADI